MADVTSYSRSHMSAWTTATHSSTYRRSRSVWPAWWASPAARSVLCGWPQWRSSSWPLRQSSTSSVERRRLSCYLCQCCSWRHYRPTYSHVKKNFCSATAPYSRLLHALLTTHSSVFTDQQNAIEIAFPSVRLSVSLSVRPSVKRLSSDVFHQLSSQGYGSVVKRLSSDVFHQLSSQGYDSVWKKRKSICNHFYSVLDVNKSQFSTALSRKLYKTRP